MTQFRVAHYWHKFMIGDCARPEYAASKEPGRDGKDGRDSRDEWDEWDEWFSAICWAFLGTMHRIWRLGSPDGALSV